MARRPPAEARVGDRLDVGPVGRAVVTGSVRDLLFVGAGGFLGAVLRYVVSGLMQGLSASTTFPFGALAVNVVGCLIVGPLAGLADARQGIGPDTRLFLLKDISYGSSSGRTTVTKTCHSTSGSCAGPRRMDWRARRS